MKIDIQKVVDKYDFSQKEASDVMHKIMKGEAQPAQLAAFLTGLRLKGEVVTEITGMAKTLRKYGQKINLGNKYAVDTTGTGGDLINTFNISTLAAFIAAAAGVPMAKQVNRSVTSQCGSADLLEQLGVVIDLPPLAVKKCIQKIGIGFMYLPVFYPDLKKTADVCQEIGIRTIINLLLPLVNPANVQGQVLGVYDEKLTSIVANVLRNLGVKTAFVVHGVEGLDEISITGPTRISELRKGSINTYTVSPEDFGLQTASLITLLGGTIEENARMSKVILSGKEQSPRTDAVLLNAAAAIAAGKKAVSLKEGLEIAQRVLYSGKAIRKLEEVIVLTRKLGKKQKKSQSKQKKIRIKSVEKIKNKNKRKVQAVSKR